MRLFFIVSFLTTLPLLVGAQCNGDEWYSAVSGLPSGVVGSSPQNTSLHLVEDGVIDVLEYYNSTEIQIEDSVFQVELCGGAGGGFLIRKASESGELVWYRQLCYDIVGDIDGTAVDSTGSIYISGYFQGTITFGADELAESAEVCYFILKVDSEGTLSWFRFGERSSGIVGLTAVDNGLMFGLAVTDSIPYDGTMYYSHPSSMSRDFQLLFTDLEGAVLWHKLISGTSNEKIYEITDVGSHSVVQGGFSNTMDYEGQSFISNSNALFQLWVDNQTGDLQLGKQATSVIPSGAVALSDTLFISAGFYHNQFIMDGFSISETDAGSNGYILAQSIENGDVQWLNDFGGANADAILSICKLNSSFAIGGEFLSPTIQYQGTTLINHGSSTEDPFILILDDMGKPSCVIEQLGDDSDDSVARLAFRNGYLYGLLSFSESTQLGPISVNALGGRDVALFRVCAPCDTLTGLNDRAPAPDEYVLLKNDPNPFLDYTDIKYETSSCENCQIIITDMNGRVVKRIALRNSNGKIRVYSSEIGTGVFSYSIIEEGRVIGSSKMISSRQ